MVRSKVTVREAAASDCEALAAIDRASSPSPWSRSSLLGAVESPSSLLLMAELGGEAAGFAALQFGGELAALDEIAVRPDLRRLGLGSALLKEAVRFATARGCSSLTLEVRAGNLPAVGLYRSAGFKPVGVRPGLYRCPDDDGAVMTLQI